MPHLTPILKGQAGTACSSSQRTCESGVPTGTGRITARLLRRRAIRRDLCRFRTGGGGWRDGDEPTLRGADRDGISQYYSDDYQGFRFARTP